MKVVLSCVSKRLESCVSSSLTQGSRGGRGGRREQRRTFSEFHTRPPEEQARWTLPHTPLASPADPPAVLVPHLSSMCSHGHHRARPVAESVLPSHVTHRLVDSARRKEWGGYAGALCEARKSWKPSVTVVWILGPGVVTKAREVGQG